MQPTDDKSSGLPHLSPEILSLPPIERRQVAELWLPIPVAALAQLIGALERAYGRGLTLGVEAPGRLAVFAGELPAAGCVQCGRPLREHVRPGGSLSCRP